MKARRFFHTPKGQLLIVLAVLTVVAMVESGAALLAPVVLGASVAAAVTDLVILRYRKGHWVVPSGAILTGLLIAMVLSPIESWWVAAGTSVIAIVSKYLIRGRTANVFNPAALALVLSYYVFGTSQSWWGALPDSPLLLFGLVVALGVYTVVETHKMPVALTFLGAHFFLFTASALLLDPEPIAHIFRSPDLHAAVFFALYMVSDPPTSPPGHRDQVVYGVITAVFSFITFQLSGIVYYLLAGLLVANVWEGWRRSRMKGHGAASARRQPGRAVAQGPTAAISVPR